jgi:hypothetical protein
MNARQKMGRRKKRKGRKTMRTKERLGRRWTKIIIIGIRRSKGIRCRRR